MEQPAPDAAGDEAMDAFLEKFRSQPYRGGFREDQWEEVGAGSASAAAAPASVGCGVGRAASRHRRL